MKLLQYQVMTMWPCKCKKFRFRFKHGFEHCGILCNFGLFKLSFFFFLVFLGSHLFSLLTNVPGRVCWPLSTGKHEIKVFREKGKIRLNCAQKKVAVKVFLLPSCPILAFRKFISLFAPLLPCSARNRERLSSSAPFPGNPAQE